MEVDDLQPDLSQLKLFEISDSSPGVVELFPAVWSALECLVAPDVSSRRKAVEYLGKNKAARISPLVAYMVSSRLGDSDLDIRAQAISILADALNPDEQGKYAPVEVRQCVESNLCEMRTRTIYGLLLVLGRYPDLLQEISRLLNSCPFAGTHLADIATSRKAPTDIRSKALQLIATVGYLDAQPALERMLVRLESRLNGQQSMPFASPPGFDDTNLLPDLKKAIAALDSN
jgi:hypothetical protein